MMSFAYWTRSCLWSSDNECGRNQEATFLLPKSSTKIWWVISLFNTRLMSHHSHSRTTFFLYLFSHFRNESLLTNRKWTPRPGFIFSRFHTTFESCIPRDEKLSPYTCLIISTISAAVFLSLKQNLMFVLCSMSLLWPRPLTTCTTWRRISRHAQRGGCGVAI